MTDNISKRPTRRRLAVLAGTSMAIGAGVAAALAIPSHTVVRAATVATQEQQTPADAVGATDGDSSQQGDQSTTDTVPDATKTTTSAEPGSAEAAAPEADAAGGWADPTGSAGVDGNFNN